MSIVYATLIYLTSPPWKGRSPSELTTQEPYFSEDFFAKPCSAAISTAVSRFSAAAQVYLSCPASPTLRLLCIPAGIQQQEQG